MNIIKINKKDYRQINATTWECKYSDWKNKWINLRCGDYWGFCDHDGKDWKVEWVEEEEEEEFEYCNCGIEKEPIFGEMSYMVAGGGMMNGNAYATIELKDGLYYYCEYGNNPKRNCVGNKIVWSDEIYDKQNPYCSRNFNILDVEEE